jgi:lipoprotein signal peptidase
VPVFIVASVLALVFVLYLFMHTPRSRWSIHVALGMILAGALGNLYDRAFVAADAVWVKPTHGWRGWLGDEVVFTGRLIRQDDRAWYFGEWPAGGDAHHRISKSRGYYVKPSPVVRDFIRIDTAWLGYQLWKWIFNVADLLLVVGVALLLVNFWMDHRRQRAAARRQGDSPVHRAPAP